MAERTRSFSVSFTGQSLIKEDVLAYDAPDFVKVANLIAASDFAFTGYEGTLRGRYGGWPMKSSFLHVSEPLVLDSLKHLGFNLLSLSNNHAFDLGPGGILSTIEEAHARGFAHAGTGATLADATRAASLEREGATVALVAMDAGPQGEHVYASDSTARIEARPGSNRLRVHTTLGVPRAELDALTQLSEQLGYEQRKSANRKVGYRQTPGAGFEFYGLRFEEADAPVERRQVDADDAERNLRAIGEAAQRADLAIVYVHHHHWEPQWERAPEWLREFAMRCVDAGAGAFVSHGVPMLQGIEIYKGAPLLYGFGNFIFHTFQAEKYTDERIWQSVIARCRFSAKGCDEIELMPIVLGGEEAVRNGRYDARRVPHIAHGSYGSSILERLAMLSSQFGTRIEIEDGRGIVRMR